MPSVLPLIFTIISCCRFSFCLFVWFWYDLRVFSLCVPYVTGEIYDINCRSHKLFFAFFGNLYVIEYIFTPIYLNVDSGRLKNTSPPARAVLLVSIKGVLRLYYDKCILAFLVSCHRHCPSFSTRCFLSLALLLNYFSLLFSFFPNPLSYA